MGATKERERIDGKYVKDSWKRMDLRCSQAIARKHGYVKQYSDLFWNSESKRSEEHCNRPIDYYSGKWKSLVDKQMVLEMDEERTL